MAASPTVTRSFPPKLALWLALAGAVSMLYYHQKLFMPRVLAMRAAVGLGNGYSFGNDFYQVWLSSQELLRHRRDPYSEEMTREIQIGLYGRPLDPSRPGDPIDRRVFPYPAFVDLLFLPSAEVLFPIVRIAVLCVLAGLTMASVPLWLRAFDWQPGWNWTAVILLLILTSYPALEGLYAGQLGLLVAFLLAASMLALRRDRYLVAGFLMALTTIKPQVTALAILYLLLWTLRDWRNRKNFYIGFFSTAAVLLCTSLAVLPHWIRNWLHTVMAYRHYTTPPLVTEVLTSPLGPKFSGAMTLVLTAASIGIAMILAWRNRGAAFGSFAFWLTLTTILSITAITILPGQAVYDHLILIPAILLFVRFRKVLADAGPVPRILLWIGTFLLCWPWIASLGLIALRPILPSAIFSSSAFLSLPIRNAAPLPFAVLALLAWTWNISAQKAAVSA